MVASPQSGSRRRKATTWSVRVGDQLASQVIKIGGIGTIVAVLLVVFVLIGNVAPLLLTASVSNPESVRWPTTLSVPVANGVDEYRILLWVLDEQGKLTVVHASTGTLLKEFASSEPLPKGVHCSSAVVTPDGSQIFVGYSDGFVQTIILTIETKFENAKDLQDVLNGRSVQGNEIAVGDRVYQPIPGGLIRSQRLAEVDFGQRIEVDSGPILHVDFLPSGSNYGFNSKSTITWTAASSSRLYFGQFISTLDSITGQSKVESTRLQSIVLGATRDARPVGVMLMSLGEQVMIATADGRVQHFNCSVSSPPSLANMIEIGGTDQVELTTTAVLLGRETLVAGDSRGNVWGVFLARSEHDSSLQQRLVAVHRIEVAKKPIEHLQSSPMSRIVLATTADGECGMVYMPTDEVIEKFVAAEVMPFDTVCFSPKGDAVAFASAERAWTAEFDPAFPEASWRGFFRPIWYEGHDAPEYMWQSSSSGVSAEFKLSMMPLIFGTLKATFYTMLLGVPLALMAAIYSSEFMDRRLRARVKPTIELMASIPSVVLGFIAALVLAPILRDSVCVVLVAFATVPFSFLLASYFWLMVPVNTAIKWNWIRPVCLVFTFLLGLWMARPIAPWVERYLFDGDFLKWLSSQHGSARGGWFLLALPLVIALVSFLWMGLLSTITRSIALRLSPFSFELFNLFRFLTGVFVVIAGTYALSLLLEGLGVDPRGTLFGMYQERNAMLVGAVLGFAVIPIIYTISEDALQSVPQHLRSASLGCGATQWQTTVRVVVPTAMSGLFSAVMIGFGRAVGETMVILCAAGNTPVMDVNPFNGYRTLSATLATELPEAARGSAHFRTLFFAALLLFCFTLLANTVAELVRLRFRRKAYQL